MLQKWCRGAIQLLPPATHGGIARSILSHFTRLRSTRNGHAKGRCRPFASCTRCREAPQVNVVEFLDELNHSLARPRNVRVLVKILSGAIRRATPRSQFQVPFTMARRGDVRLRAVCPPVLIEQPPIFIMLHAHACTLLKRSDWSESATGNI